MRVPFAFLLRAGEPRHVVREHEQRHHRVFAGFGRVRPAVVGEDASLRQPVERQEVFYARADYVYPFEVRREGRDLREREHVTDKDVGVHNVAAEFFVVFRVPARVVFKARAGAGYGNLHFAAEFGESFQRRLNAFRGHTENFEAVLRGEYHDLQFVLH